MDTLLDEPQPLLRSGIRILQPFNRIRYKLPKLHLRQDLPSPRQQLNTGIFENDINATALSIINQFLTNR